MLSLLCIRYVSEWRKNHTSRLCGCSGVGVSLPSLATVPGLPTLGAPARLASQRCLEQLLQLRHGGHHVLKGFH